MNTTTNTDRPPLEHVLEDLSLEEVRGRYASAMVTLRAVLSELVARAPDMNVDELWDVREDVREGVGDVTRPKGMLDQDLARRFREADATQLAGDLTMVKLATKPTFTYDVPRLRSCAERGLMSWEDYAQLVKLVETPDKRVFNELVKRGGELKTELEAALTVKEGSPSFEAKAR